VYEELIADRKLAKVLKNPLTGRVRRFHMRASDKLKRIMKATLLQQVESHLLKLALIRLHSEFQLRSADARIVAAIHDSLWVECLKKEAAQVRHLMETTLTTVAKLEVPLEVDFS
jgi:DNA polymerase I-like protein with 3'-5' exonuclease and polymerase domains